MATCDSCGRELQFDGKLRVTCCGIVYRLRRPNKQERQEAVSRWNNWKPGETGQRSWSPFHKSQT